MVPDVGRSRPRIIFDVVVLPQPDSPTRPRVCPAPMSKEIPSTARTVAVERPSMPWRTGKCLVRPSTARSARGSAVMAPSRGGRVKPAAGQVVGAEGERGRLLDAAALHHGGAARGQTAAPPPGGAGR